MNVKMLLTAMIVVGHALYNLKKMLTAEVRYTCKIVCRGITVQCIRVHFRQWKSKMLYKKTNQKRPVLMVSKASHSSVNPR